jgi:hypothetical protein
MVTGGTWDRRFAQGARWVIIVVKMSHSKAERQANVDLALKLFMERLGTKWIQTFLIDPNCGDFEDLFSTTWSELTDRYYYINKAIGHLYVLTSAGWMKGLELTGVLGSSTFNDQVGELCACLKRRVKGRNQPALATLEDVATETKLPAGFISNLIDADYINLSLKRYSASWAKGFEGTLLIVPTNFGLEWL